MRIDNMLDTYRAARIGEVKSPANLDMNVEHLKAYLGHLTLEDLWDPAHLKAYVAARAAGEVTWTDELGRERGGHEGGPAATKREIGVLATAACYAVANRLYSGQLPKFDRPADPPPRPRWLMREEAIQIIRHMRPAVGEKMSRQFRAFLLLIFTGARKGAVEGLTWDRVRILFSGKTFGFVDYRDPRVSVSLKRRAAVPITEELARWLKRMQREATTPYVLDHTGDCRYLLEKEIEAAGITDFNIHCLRKTFATWAAQDGVPMIMIANALGDTLATTEKSYAIYHPDYAAALVHRPALMQDGPIARRRILKRTVRRSV